MGDPLAMSTEEKIDQVTEEINRKLEHLFYEYSLTNAEIIGILEIIKLNIYRSGFEEEDGKA